MLRIRYLRLRAETSVGPFGVDIRFEAGLNVLRADNTTGKSTCLQGLLYALGLERMLSPRRDIPLTYVMTSHLEDPRTGTRYDVLESSVSVELQNAAGEMITVRRGVKSAADRRLVSVFHGPLLTEPTGHYTHRDYFVLDPGAVQREAGFHRFLTEFIGWQLPRVRRFDGRETILYLETIFPLLYVEQKAGWSSIPAAFPTYFQIRDVGRRAVEFLMGLETHEVELRRQELDQNIATSKVAWSTKRDEIQSIARLVNARVEGISDAPTISGADLEKSFLTVAHGDDWLALDVYVSLVRARIEELNNEEVPTVEEIAGDTAAELERLTAALAEKNADRSALFRARQAELGRRFLITRRIGALEEDLQKNLDAQKLRSFGSKIADVFTADHCPTCAQPIHDTLLAQQVTAEIMTVEDNIEYIKSQREIFLRMQEQAEVAIADIERQLASASAEVNEMSARLRALRADMVAASHTPSIARLEERLRWEARLQALEDVQQRFEEQKLALLSIAARHAELLAERSALPDDRLTKKDRAKLESFTTLIREQVGTYGFSTFPPSEIDISPDNYRPQKEGFEIGFELSASDAIRLKWAYQLALMEMTRSVSTNHPGFIVFDEPRQQETAKLSFRRLLRRAATSKSAGQQVIFATSEDREQLTAFLKDVDCQLLLFDGPIVQRI